MLDDPVVRARVVAIDMNHGIYVGRSSADPVLITQSLRAFNLLGEPQSHFSEEEIEHFTREFRVRGSLQSETTDPDYGGVKFFIAGNPATHAAFS